MKKSTFRWWLKRRVTSFLSLKLQLTNGKSFHFNFNFNDTRIFRRRVPPFFPRVPSFELLSIPIYLWHFQQTRGERDFDIKTREDERISAPPRGSPARKRCEEVSEAQKKRTRWRYIYIYIYIYTRCEITSAARKLPALFTRNGRWRKKHESAHFHFLIVSLDEIENEEASSVASKRNGSLPRASRYYHL